MNADFDAKRRRAVAIIEDKKLWVSGTQRAIFESLWSIGIPVRPPQFYGPVGLGLVVRLMFGAAGSSDVWVFFVHSTTNTFYWRCNHEIRSCNHICKPIPYSYIGAQTQKAKVTKLAVFGWHMST